MVETIIAKEKNIFSSYGNFNPKIIAEKLPILKRLIIFTGILILFTQPLFAAEVNLISAEEVALNFIIYLDENHTIR
ncbi:MAG: hypothetical protein HQK67_12490, partial [Desulfamplus sp.]|nr:hypothetical protein [Desulfamplus sp.]